MFMPNQGMNASSYTIMSQWGKSLHCQGMFRFHFRPEGQPSNKSCYNPDSGDSLEYEMLM
jgi:hypothetical protein